MRSYKSFWQGGSWVISIPSSIAQSVGLNKNDIIMLKLEGDKIIVTNPPDDAVPIKRPKKVDDNTYLVLLRVIGAEGMSGNYPYAQLGFTIPREVADRFAKVEFEVSLIEKSEDSFKIAYVPVKTVKNS